MYAEAAVMPPKRKGRPHSERQDVSVKVDKFVVGMARHVALARGISLAEYLTELVRPHVKADYARILREIEAAKEEETPRKRGPKGGPK